MRQRSVCAHEYGTGIGDLTGPYTVGCPYSGIVILIVGGEKRNIIRRIRTGYDPAAGDGISVVFVPLEFKLCAVVVVNRSDGKENVLPVPGGGNVGAHGNAGCKKDPGGKS